MQLSEYTVKLIKKEVLTQDVVELLFSKPEGFDYEAGQFIQCIIPDGEAFVKRSYSLCSTTKDSHLALCIKMLPEGKGSQFFRDMNVGDSLTIKGPLGRFVCSDEKNDHFFIATGVGVAPIMGMIEDQLKNKKTDKNIYLLFGLRFEKERFWLDKLNELSNNFQNFSYDITISRPEENWDGLSGRVTDHIKKHDSSHDFYICGNGEMVKDVRETLLERGVQKEDIHFEIF